MAYNFSTFKEETKKVEEWLANTYSGLHTGRATPIVLDSVQIESYGTRMPVKNVASVSIEDPKTLRVTPWDKTHIKEIEKAVQAANLGLSVATDEAGLRVIFPMLTEENRMKLVKVLKEKLEDARISIRKERESVLNDIKTIPSEDEIFNAKQELQELVDKANANLEALFDKKEKEVLN
jgi:ribosome recycling factor